jgi:hypothetical protein
MNTETPKEPLIDGLTKTQWASVARTLASDAGWMSVATLLSPAVAEANETLYNSQEPSRQNALHEAIGFLKFANKLSEIKDRARFISERGVSPDAAIRNDPV